MDQIKLGATIVKKFTITNSAGNLADPDGVAVLPVGVLSKNGVATAVAVTVTKVTTGDYYATFSILAADGFAANNIAELAITATIDTLDKKVLIWSAQVLANDNDTVASAVSTVDGKVDVVNVTTVMCRKILKNKAVIDTVNSKIIIYDDNGVDVLYQGTLTDKDGSPVVLEGTGPANRTALA